MNPYDDLPDFTKGQIYISNNNDGDYAPLGNFVSGEVYQAHHHGVQTATFTVKNESREAMEKLFGFPMTEEPAFNNNERSTLMNTILRIALTCIF